MTRIQSRLDTRSDAFKANAARTQELVAELRDKVAGIGLGGGER